ncbi:putative bZIP transcription factor (MetR) [Aspergillus clavatus NRRL 1]|uniref:BZIP transcription factor (MetR), putative n=1 Tax=Aspergillus clavatus (strain ATCC 1007 / CBS 513.65 / DSM 816 / NCTC 3887 / NRRL 1 / QM 1276 / 107) TaxID=344612 RepID=A1CGW1_ASPCL|nr:bZIP transcription factor (MetR), putative [Aspergillus clavatus NRRL 1]EAW10116.1 bZIP transcription factor (MetR), putative [Aspergillus clavatus NRRL 1]
MSGFNGRRAPNFSQYIEDLNAIPSPYDQALQQQQRQDTFNLDAELSLFTNTEFFDFDSFGDLNLPTFKDDGLKTDQQNGGQTAHNPDLEFLNLLGDGFGNMPDFSAPNLNSANSQPPSIATPQFPEVPSVSTGIASAPYNVKPSPAQSTSSATSPSIPASSPIAAAAPASVAPPKRKNTQKTAAISVEEAARVAAEEDKRRRNTAASARFRVKKKLREQALEKTVKETNEKNAALEARVTALELENQWLKNLITEKNGKTSEETKQSENDIADMFKKFLASQQPDAPRRTHESKLGVGTV